MIELGTIKHKLNLYRRYPHWKKQGVIFIHVPKVAGTSINKAIYGRTLGHYTAVEIKNKFPILYKDSFVFSFVRNPWSRLVSAYKFAKQGRTESMGVRNPKQYQIPEFDNFESFVKEWLVNQDVNEIDYIFQPQERFLSDNKGDIIADYVGKLETLKSDLRFVGERLNKTLNVQHSNKTTGGLNYRNEYISDEMVEIVAAIYKKDIKLFNYEF
jgi:hypothetical protein